MLWIREKEKPSALKREHPALQKMKFVNLFLCLWVISALLDPDSDTDPGTPLHPNPIQIRIHSIVSKFVWLLLNLGTFTSVFKDNKSLRCHKTVEIQVFKIVLVDTGNYGSRSEKA